MALLAVGFLGVKNTQAATSSFVRGAALWGSNGYLYFSCLDDIMGDRLDDPYNLCGGTYASPYCRTSPDNVFHFYSAPCSNSTHQVVISSNGNLSGSAWNASRGFVTFDATSSHLLSDYSFSAYCPNICNTSNNCLACYNENTQKVYGWARVMTDNSWVNLSPATTSPTVQLKSWNSASSTSTFYSSSYLFPGDFIGYASSTGDKISFNCLSEDGGVISCNTYKVYVSNLQVGYMSAPNWNTDQACNGMANTAYLKWYLKSGTQTAYRVIINTSNTSSNPVFDSGKNYSAATQLVCPTSNCRQNVNGALWTPSYNTPYYWWVQLWDQNDNATEFYQYIYNSSSDSDSNRDGIASTFQTYKHEFPSPYFTWTPSSVLVAATTTFSLVPKYYTIASPSSSVATCSGSSCATTWSTSDAGASIVATTSSVTDIFFKTATGTTVTLLVSDQDNYQCSLPQTVNVNYGLPIWREVKAQ